MAASNLFRAYQLIIEKTKGGSYPSTFVLLGFLSKYDIVISERTLSRYITNIRNDFGLELVYSRSRKGYYIDEEISVDSDNLFKFLDLVNTASLVFDNFQENKNTLNYVLFDQAYQLKGSANLTPLLQAIKENRVVSFTHHKFDKNIYSKRFIKPYLLKEYQYRWYVVGLNENDELRTYGVDRISELDIKDEVFKRNNKLDIENHFQEVIGIVYSNSDKELVRLKFKPSQANYLKTLKLHPTQEIISDTDEGIVIDLYLRPNYELKQVVLKHSDTVTVLKPESLKQEIKLVYQEALKRFL